MKRSRKKKTTPLSPPGCPQLGIDSGFECFFGFRGPFIGFFLNLFGQTVRLIKQEVSFIKEYENQYFIRKAESF